MRWHIGGALVVVAVLVTAGCLGAVDLSAGDEWAFQDATEAAGLDYEATASGVGNGNSGVYATDFNNDGWPDVLAIGGEEPTLFENTGGEFERSHSLPELDVTVQGALFFDADGDAWEDLLLLPRNGNAVFLENHRGTFTHRENGLGVDLGVAVGASAADYDGDGDLDVFVVQYGDWVDGTPEGYLHPDGGYVAADNGAPNLLFENTDDGFERVENAGIEGDHWSLATSFVDLTDDGYPDVHVANDFNNDTLYRNRGNGTFERVVMGSATARNGMSSEAGDFTGDGHPDLFVTNIYFPLDEANLSEEKASRLERYFSFVLRSKRIEGNNLLVNDNGSFTDASATYRVQQGGWGWAAAFTDLNNDMHRDLFHATQRVVRIDEADPHYTYPMLWQGSAERFEKREAGKLGFAETDGRGVSALDYDRDGDVDLLVSTYDGALTLYENNAADRADGNSLQIRVVGTDGESTAIGATVRTTVDGTTQFAVQNAKADYQSQDARILHFGLADNEEADRVRVSWPDGTHRTFENVTATQRIVVSPNGSMRSAPPND